MTQDRTEITIINPKSARPPSMWMNLFSLIVLCAMIMGMRYMSTKWAVPTPPPESPENQIVLEDLENEKPMAESLAIEMTGEGGRTTDQGLRTTDYGPGIKKGPRTMDHGLKAKKLKKIAKHKKPGVKVAKKVSEYAKPDPYTDGGAQDLDLPANQPMKGVPSQARATKPASQLDERDLFIPFESN